jgi:hypothetical protein
MDEINQDYDTEIISILGSYDGLYPLQVPEEGCLAYQTKTVNKGHSNIRRSD